MENNLNNISLGNIYSKRIIVKRYYLNKGLVQKESLFVFARVLSFFYSDTSFSFIKNPSRGILKFDTYSYSDGYILEIYYEQIDNKKVDLYLNNSYLKTDIFINNIIENRFDEVPYIIVTSKEKAVADYKKLSNQSLDLLLLYSGINYSLPILDINLINSFNYSEVERILSVIKSRARLQEIIIDKNHNLLSYNTSKKKEIYSFNYNPEVKDIYNNSGESTLGYIFEFDEIKTLKDYSVLSIIIDKFKETLRNNLYLGNKLDCHINYFDISRIRGMITISFSSKNVLNKKELVEREITNFFSNEINIDNNMLLFEKLKGTKLLTSYKDAISRLKLIQDYLFNVDYSSFFYKFDIKEEDIKNLFYSMKLIKNYNSFDDGSI